MYIKHRYIHQRCHICVENGMAFFSAVLLEKAVIVNAGKKIQDGIQTKGNYGYVVNIQDVLIYSMTKLIIPNGIISLSSETP